MPVLLEAEAISGPVSGVTHRDVPSDVIDDALRPPIR
jgi:hypothetical protein